jgi:membrane protein involved in colicin uptake
LNTCENISTATIAFLELIKPSLIIKLREKMGAMCS